MRQTPVLVILLLMLLSPLALSMQNQVSNSDFSSIAEPRTDQLNPAQNHALQAAGFARGTNTNWTIDGGSQGDDTIYEIQMDSNGDVIICGRVENDTQLGTITISTQGNGDIIIAKVTAGGTWAWATVVGAAEYVDSCRGIDIGPDDEVYATGYMRNTMDFGSITVYTPPDGWDGWIGRIDSNGTWAWAESFGGMDIDVGWDIALDSKGNLAVTGYFQNTSTFGAAGEINSLKLDNVYRYFLAYYNTSAGDFDWVKTSRGLGYSTAFQLVIDQSDDSIYTAGYNNGDEDYGSNNSSYPAGTWAGVVLKYNTHGDVIWLKSVSSSSCPNIGQNCGVYFNNIVLHPSGGVVVGGHFTQDYIKINGQRVNSKGGWDLLVMYIDSNGNEVWAEDGGSNVDESLNALSINLKGQVQIGGSQQKTMNLGYVQVNYTKSTVYSDFFIAQISTNGIWQWGRSNGGGENDNIGALLALPDGSLVAAGDFSGTLNLDNSYLTATGRDMFIWHFYHDADDDGVPDYSDNCMTTANLNQSNYEMDSWGDACDTDDDNDGLHDVLDDCNQGFIGWNQSDTAHDLDQDGCNDDEEDTDDDSDGVLDIDDTCPRGNHTWISSNITDIDGDGCQDIDEDDDDDDDTILDIDDNCHVMANTNQTNYDGDSLGDICDLDDDSDGVDDNNDLCPLGANDWDSNGITDADGDGCRDSDEDNDDDGDGMNDVDESGDCSPGDTDWISNLTTTDIDGDGCRDASEDSDDDSDGMSDDIDNCPQGIVGWVRNTTTDSDNDGCRDIDEDLNDDNDEYPDITDDCPLTAGSANQGGKRGCSDSDNDGWADTLEPISFVLDPSQWSDGDDDGFGDNPSGNNADDCPFIFGNSTVNILGCIDSDGDGWADVTSVFGIFDGADALPFEPTQNEDLDGDGYGDDLDGDNPDYCINSAGTSTIDRLGCKDSDGDGYSDSSSSWSVERWDTFDLGPDMFKNEATQWRDSDGDGFGDNWADDAISQTRPSEWPGMWVANATLVDNCPLEDPGEILNEQNPGCNVVAQADGDTKDSANDDVSSNGDSPVSTTMLVAITGVIVVLILVAIIVRILKSSDTGGAKLPPLRGPPLPPGGGEPSIDLAQQSVAEEISEEIKADDVVSTEDVVVQDEVKSGPKTVASWQELPNGNYLEPDAKGTVWYRDVDDNSWYQNADETWSMWE
jgi:hypothetical protein